MPKLIIEGGSYLTEFPIDLPIESTQEYKVFIQNIEEFLKVMERSYGSEVVFVKDCKISDDEKKSLSILKFILKYYNKSLTARYMAGGIEHDLEINSQNLRNFIFTTIDIFSLDLDNRVENIKNFIKYLAKKLEIEGEITRKEVMDLAIEKIKNLPEYDMIGDLIFGDEEISEILKGDREHTLYKKYEEEYQNYTEGQVVELFQSILEAKKQGLFVCCVASEIPNSGNLFYTVNGQAHNYFARGTIDELAKDLRGNIEHPITRQMVGMGEFKPLAENPELSDKYYKLLAAVDMILTWIGKFPNLSRFDQINNIFDYFLDFEEINEETKNIFKEMKERIPQSQVLRPQNNSQQLNQGNPTIAI